LNPRRQIARVDGFDAASSEAHLHLSPRSRALPDGAPGLGGGKFDLPRSDGEDDAAAGPENAAPLATRKRGRKDVEPKAPPALTLPWGSLLETRLCTSAQ
jgi:hypothetical protein